MASLRVIGAGEAIAVVNIECSRTVFGTEESEKAGLVEYLFPFTILSIGDTSHWTQGGNSMRTLTENSSNLLRISREDVSLYERATWTFEQRVNTSRSTDSAPSATSSNIDSSRRTSSSK